MCVKYLKELHAWPIKLNEILDEAEDKHSEQKDAIIKEVANKREQLKKDIKDLEEVVGKISEWGVRRW